MEHYFEETQDRYILNNEKVPLDIWSNHIFIHLSRNDLKALRQTCNRMSKILTETGFWKQRITYKDLSSYINILSNAVCCKQNTGNGSSKKKADGKNPSRIAKMFMISKRKGENTAVVEGLFTCAQKRYPTEIWSLHISRNDQIDFDMMEEWIKLEKQRRMDPFVNEIYFTEETEESCYGSTQVWFDRKTNTCINIKEQSISLLKFLFKHGQNVPKLHIGPVMDVKVFCLPIFSDNQVHENSKLTTLSLHVASNAELCDVKDGNTKKPSIQFHDHLGFIPNTLTSLTITGASSQLTNEILSKGLPHLLHLNVSTLKLWCINNHNNGIENGCTHPVDNLGENVLPSTLISLQVKHLFIQNNQYMLNRWLPTRIETLKIDRIMRPCTRKLTIISKNPMVRSVQDGILQLIRFNPFFPDPYGVEDEYALQPSTCSHDQESYEEAKSIWYFRLSDKDIAQFEDSENPSIGPFIFIEYRNIPTTLVKLDIPVYNKFFSIFLSRGGYKTTLEKTTIEDDIDETKPKRYYDDNDITPYRIFHHLKCLKLTFKLAVYESEFSAVKTKMIPSQLVFPALKNLTITGTQYITLNSQQRGTGDTIQRRHQLTHSSCNDSMTLTTLKSLHLKDVTISSQTFNLDRFTNLRKCVLDNSNLSYSQRDDGKNHEGFFSAFPPSIQKLTLRSCMVVRTNPNGPYSEEFLSSGTETLPSLSVFKLFDFDYSCEDRLEGTLRNMLNPSQYVTANVKNPAGYGYSKGYEISYKDMKEFLANDIRWNGVYMRGWFGLPSLFSDLRALCYAISFSCFNAFEQITYDMSHMKRVESLCISMDVPVNYDSEPHKWKVTLLLPSEDEWITCYRSNERGRVCISPPKNILPLQTLAIAGPGFVSIGNSFPIISVKTFVILAPCDLSLVLPLFPNLKHLVTYTPLADKKPVRFMGNIGRFGKKGKRRYTEFVSLLPNSLETLTIVTWDSVWSMNEDKRRSEEIASEFYNLPPRLSHLKVKQLKLTRE